MSSSYSVSLPGPAPWGFRLQGGKDFCMPLTVSKLTDGGKAAVAGIAVGDVVVSIEGHATIGMTHLEAQNKIKACVGNLSLALQRASGVSKAAAVAKEEPQEIIKPVPVSHPPAAADSSSPAAGPAYNKTARPFGGGASVSPAPFSSAPKVASIPSASSAFTPAAPTSSPAAPTSTPAAPTSTPAAQPPFPIGGSASRPAAPLSSSPKPSPGRSTLPPPASTSGPVAPQPSVYNTPISLYSNENACEVALGQRRGLLEKLGGAEHLNGASRKPVPDLKVEPPHGPPPHGPPPHGPPPSDVGKKRLVEDTEDWHTRSGTSQSRSFRMLAQMTGTESEKGMENIAVKNETVVEPQPSTHHSSALKVMTKAPAGTSRSSPAGAAQGFKPPSWQGGSPAGPVASKGVAEKGQVTALPGRVGPGAPKGPVSDRPVPQPHPKDQDSLVQQAEHMPAGTRTPMCANCNKVIRGPFLVAMGKSWHPEEFNCAHCHTSLAEMGFVEERGSNYCARCYEEFLAPVCTRCRQKILGEVINALKQTWHVRCFLCVSCQQPIRNNTFHLEDGEPYCERDYYTLFGTNCHGCDFPIEAGDKFLEALGFTWHDTCFVCAVCSTSLEGQTFFSKKDKPLCKNHAHTVKI
uniref:PDZ and LIM domain 5b n=1 Tax=Paramormyrops kingsleyae TaxID=1676925 RepID=A0A3B3Q5X2_9TELE|nr:PDZ and LIM domain protein 5-like [Paramormyrops kingsleyae]XP_023664156.1 PDZ and LIM domain protein 5-like [Paramormyrops kingsleyae]XP_023664157.1 PDZ and LIM domain protein 5-like [Paramormyrops kingsleyae]XP_023664158.1 PDZ and LIM domain protein 5-like [Paramormyrops kingsleyae]XP_023664159.1 PDZ and LIM domain protein 5-like [Paramormyrops kingsleyae]